MPDLQASDRLFQVDLDQFVAERNALAKQLKAEGQKEEAARIAKLRRPAATVWALNQVARTDSRLVDSMLGAGATLRAAMERALGGDASSLRAARTAESRAVEDVVAAASERLRGGGHSATDATQRRMATTLRAAIVDDVVADQLRSGTLDVDCEASGFGLDALSVPEAAATMRPTADADAEERERRRQQRARRDELVAAADRLSRRAERLEAEAIEAERRAADARTAADQAAGDAHAARSKAAEAAEA